MQKLVCGEGTRVAEWQENTTRKEPCNATRMIAATILASLACAPTSDNFENYRRRPWRRDIHGGFLITYT